MAEKEKCDKYGKRLSILKRLGVGGCFDTVAEGNYLYMICGKETRLTGKFESSEANSGTLLIADISRPESPVLKGRVT
ncbi:MAG: hypothetical protein PHG48_08315, partial [Eubacteriales bacterium]|nr:hypothetical protein [Eubacteriales bacterium]